jgi:S1-C subfamily serine protease
MGRLNSPLLVLVLVCTSIAQVAPPKHESNYAHVKQARAENYSQRFNEARCAIVEILRDNTFGTGFYINEDGDVLTASHVAGRKVWTSTDTGPTVDLLVPAVISVVTSSNEIIVLPRSAVEENRENWAVDLAVIKTGKKVKKSCWLASGNASATKPGDHVITVGFPGLAFGATALYSGIVSAAKMKTNLPVGQTTTLQDVIPKNEFVRVQMPISGGLSGAPVLDDQNRVIAVVTNAGLWSDQMDRLIGMWDTNQLGPALVQPPAVPQKDTLNLAWVIGVLAKSFHQYSSPGYGDCVPLSYLKKQPEKSVVTSSKSAR